MTQTTTDYLFQLTPPVTDRAYGSTSASDGAGRFDDHLSQLSTSSGNDSRNNGGGSLRADTPRNDANDRGWRADNSKPIERDAVGSASSEPSPSSHDESASQVAESKAPTTDTNQDTDDDQSDDTTAAEAAGANQAQHGSSKNDRVKSAENAKSAAAAKAENSETAAKTGEGKTNSNANGQTANSATSADEDDEQAAQSESERKQAKATKTGTPPGKSKVSADSAKVGSACDEAVNAGAAGSETQVDVAQQAAEQVVATGALSAKNDATDSDKSSDDDSANGSRNDTRAGSQSDPVAPTVKVDAAQLVAPNISPTDASANAVKSKNSEQSTKPIAAIGETAAAAFARMTRGNSAGVNDTNGGTNDTPQVDPSRFVGRVAKAFQTAQDRGGTLQIRLSPPELGALRIELSVKDGVMSASLETENSNARKLLLDHLPALRDRLAEQNIRVDRFDVDVRRDGSGSQSDARGSQQQQFQHESDQSAPRRQAQLLQRTREAAAPEPTVTAPSVSDAGLNLIV